MSIELVDEVLSTARSVRRKLDFERPIERQVLLDCINVAVQAPTGLGGENWRFIVVDEMAQKAQIAELYREILLALLAERNMPIKPSHQALIDRMGEIPAMIFVCVEGEPLNDSVGSQVAFYGSILPAAWSLMLALRARDIGTTWTSLLSGRQEAVNEILGCPSSVVQTVMLPLGYTKDAVLKRADRLDATQVTYFNGWAESK